MNYYRHSSTYNINLIRCILREEIVAEEYKFKDLISHLVLGAWLVTLLILHPVPSNIKHFISFSYKTCRQHYERNKNTISLLYIHDKWYAFPKNTFPREICVLCSLFFVLRVTNSVSRLYIARILTIYTVCTKSPKNMARFIIFMFKWTIDFSEGRKSLTRTMRNNVTVISFKVLESTGKFRSG